MPTIELDGPIHDRAAIPYNQAGIQAIVRRILTEARSHGQAAMRLIQMHGQLERGVSWVDGPGLTFHPDGSRTSHFTLTRGLDVDPMTINVRVTADEVKPTD